MRYMPCKKTVQYDPLTYCSRCSTGPAIRESGRGHVPPCLMESAPMVYIRYL